MQGTERAFDLLIIGGGPAGLLAATVFGRHGYSVACVEVSPDLPARQSDHVHLFQAESLNTIDAWMPGFMRSLVENGAIRVDGDGYTVAAGAGHPHPSRAVLDTTLRVLCEQRIFHAKALAIHDEGDCWRLQLSDGGDLSGRRIIDASGQARRSLSGVSTSATSQLVLHEGPRTGGYLSTVVSRLGTPPDLGVMRIRGSENSPGLLGIRLDCRRWQVTLQFPAGAALTSWEAAVNALPPSVREMFSRHRRVTPAIRCGGRRSTFLGADKPCRPGNWLPIGDALLCTPPYQGNGLANIVSQLRCIDEGLEIGSSFEQISDQVWDEAQSVWMQAAMMDAISNPSILEALANRRTA